MGRHLLYAVLFLMLSHSLCEAFSFWSLFSSSNNEETTTPLSTTLAENYTSTTPAIEQENATDTVDTTEITTEQPITSTVIPNNTEPLALPAVESENKNCSMVNDTEAVSSNGTVFCDPQKFATNETEKHERKRRNTEEASDGKKMYGEVCETTEECFEKGVCSVETGVCLCDEKYPATDKSHKCDVGVLIGGSCTFDEQCEYFVPNSVCDQEMCVCRGGITPEYQPDGSLKCKGKKFGDKCSSTEECGFKHAICDPHKNSCQCKPEYGVTNHIDKCGKLKNVGEYCNFHEECEQMLFDTTCKGGICACRFEGNPVKQLDGTIKCIAPDDVEEKQYVDPAMIIGLSGVCLMFIILCVVLHLFSRARWRENRTIFNTPNPRLMNVSLLKEKKDRKESRSSVKALSRDPSLASLHHHSPSVESKSMQCRRESRIASTNGSVHSPVTKIPPGTQNYAETEVSISKENIGSTV